ncbi:DNA-directed RNA polymerase III subunit RPC8, partial [Linum perenne]
FTVSIGFFDDIFVPANQLPQPCHHIPDPDRRYKVRWIWEYDIEETGNPEQYNIDGLDEVRFQVLSVNFPTLPIELREKPFAPMVITGSISDSGLGPVSYVSGLGRNRGYRHIVVFDITGSCAFLKSGASFIRAGDGVMITRPEQIPERVYHSLNKPTE